ncbi:MAG: anthranilate phosphoribosyltransferase [Proteobacteria bacterium]|nr:MAG: anthranilate phosphoribosyltransferase [Pseudomonadota bacterium]
MSAPLTIKDALRRIVAGGDLTEQQAHQTMELVMSGEATDAQIAGLLTALRIKGETVDEITGAVRAMRDRVVPIALSADRILDTCGTGGTGNHTFNISTAVAFVCAAAGATVAKHGNRAVSSRVGSADVIEALGIRIDLDAAAIVKCIEDLGVGFMFAPTHHTALRHAAPARRQLGLRTILNMLGPMTNPAGATHQLIGIYDHSRLETVARVLGRLGSTRALVVHGQDGLDEVTLGGATFAAALEDGQVRTLTITPEDFRIERAPAAALKGGTRTYNAALIDGILAGRVSGPPADVVRLNAGCALWVAELTDTVEEGVAEATKILASGAAHDKLEALAAMTQELGS